MNDPPNDEKRNASSMIQTLEWTPGGVVFIDQTKLPTEEVYVTCTTHQQVADVIRNMVVRGAPAIGVAAAMGIALGVKNSKAENAPTSTRVRPDLRNHPPDPAHRGEFVLGDPPHDGEV